MREKKFTPGPWDREMAFKTYKRYDSKRDGLLMVEIGENAGSTQIKFDEEWEANANLISAAPELLEALEELAGLFCINDEEDYLAHGKAQSAIKKAYGETE